MSKRVIIRFKKPSIKSISKKKLFKRTALVLFVFIVFALGITIGSFKAILQNLPDISDLEEFEPNIITSIYADDGEVIGEYAIEKRIEIGLYFIYPPPGIPRRAPLAGRVTLVPGRAPLRNHPTGDMNGLTLFPIQRCFSMAESSLP